jgi:hypothetical protein
MPLGANTAKLLHIRSGTRNTNKPKQRRDQLAQLQNPRNDIPTPILTLALSAKHQPQRLPSLPHSEQVLGTLFIHLEIIVGVLTDHRTIESLPRHSDHFVGKCLFPLIAFQPHFEVALGSAHVLARAGYVNMFVAFERVAAHYDDTGRSSTFSQGPVPECHDRVFVD